MDDGAAFLPWWEVLAVAVVILAATGFGRSALAADADATSVEESAVDAAAPEVGQDEPRDLRFTFRYAPWEDVLEWLAEQSELALSKDVIPTGTFNYWDPNRTFTLHEAMDVINKHLLVIGYTLVRNEQTLLVLDYESEVDRQLLRELLTETPLEELDKRGDFEMTKTTFVLEHMDPAEAEKQVNQLLTPPFGHLVVMPGANRILATDTGRTLRKIRAIFEGIEETAEAEDKNNVHIFRLSTANATEVLAAVRPLVNLDDDENAAEDGTIRISANPGGNTVFAAGTPEKVKIVKQVVESMDSGGASDPYGDEQPQFIAHRLNSAQPEAVLRVLQTLLQDDPSVRLEIDGSGGGIMALARPSQHAMIRATIAQMDQNSDRLVVLPLTINDPADVITVVGSLFATTQTPPIVSGTVDPPQLIVRGSDSQIEKIRELLENMGERWGPSPLMANARGNVRLFQMDPEQARVLLDRIEQIWPRLSDNPVHVVRPDGQSSSIRTLRPEPAVIEGSLRRPVQQGTGRADETGPLVEGVGGDNSETEGSTEGDRTTAVEAGASSRPTTAGFRILAVSDEAPAEENGANLGSGTAFPAESSFEPADPDGSTATDQGETGRLPGITIVPTPGGLMVTSEDEEALGSIESLIEMFAGQSEAGGPRYHLFYLKHVSAEEASQLLTSLLAGSTTTTTTTTTAGRSYGVIGGTGSATFTGLAGSPIAASPPTVVADKRLNSLFVQGTAAQVRLIDQLLQVIDIESGPEEVLTFPRPHFIPVYNTSAEEVVAVLEKLYVHRIETGQANGRGGRGGRGGDNDDWRSRFGGRFGGFGGRDNNDDRGGGVRQDVAGTLAKMTLAADTTSNSVVVSAPGPLVQEVEMVVRDIDSRAAETPPPTVGVVSLKYANSGYIKDALVNALGDMAQTSQTTRTPNASTNGSRRFGEGRGFSFQGNSGDFFRRGGFGRGDAGRGDFGRGRFGGGNDGGRERGGRGGRDGGDRGRGDRD